MGGKGSGKNSGPVNNNSKAALKANEWKPGQSGNPAGRSVGPNFKTILDKILSGEMTITEAGEKKKLTKREVMAISLVQIALNPREKGPVRLKAKEMIMDRTDGKPKQTIDLPAGSDGEPITGIEISFKKPTKKIKK